MYLFRNWTNLTEIHLQICAEEVFVQDLEDNAQIPLVVELLKESEDVGVAERGHHL